MEGLLRENARLVKENNELHHQALRDAEAADARERAATLAARAAADEVSELLFWKRAQARAPRLRPRLPPPASTCFA